MKKSIRAELISRRDSIPQDQKEKKDAAILNNLFHLEEFIDAKSVLMHVSFRTEVDTFRQLDGILNLGKKLILPLVDSKQKTLTLYEIENIGELVPGYMGILEPNVSEDRKVKINDIDIVVIPGTGFDITGNRLGYGGGYYDRLLSSADKTIPKIALAFEEQILDLVPSEPHDMKMDIIVSDERVIRIPAY